MLSVTASVSDGGTLTYQWYSNTAKSNSGGTVINDATDRVYSPSTAAAGTFYYYVVVTNTNNRVNGARTATTRSSVATVMVTEPVHNEAVQAKALKAYAQNGTLHVSGLTAGKQWYVYGVAGALVYSAVADSEETDVYLSVRGVYIVKSGNGTAKVIVN